MKKNQNRVHREGGAKGASAQARSQSTTQAAKGLKTYRVFTAKAGETDMARWKQTGLKQARSPLDAARQLLGRRWGEFERRGMRWCATQGETDYIFDLVKGTGATLAPAPDVAVTSAAAAPAAAEGVRVSMEDLHTLDRVNAELLALNFTLITMLESAKHGAPSDTIIDGLVRLSARPHAELTALNEKLWAAKHAKHQAAEGRAACLH